MEVKAKQCGEVQESLEEDIRYDGKTNKLPDCGQ